MHILSSLVFHSSWNSFYPIDDIWKDLIPFYLLVPPSASRAHMRSQNKSWQVQMLQSAVNSTQFPPVKTLKLQFDSPRESKLFSCNVYWDILLNISQLSGTRPVRKLWLAKNDSSRPLAMVGMVSGIGPDNRLWSIWNWRSPTKFSPMSLGIEPYRTFRPKSR